MRADPRSDARSRVSMAIIGVLLAALPFSPGSAIAQTVPDSIAAEGVPAVPEALVRQVGRYQNMRSASFQDWLAGRREMLILTRFADTNQVHRVATSGGARQQLTFLPERVLAAVARPGHQQFLYTMDQGGAENYQLFLSDLATGDSTRVSDGRARHTSPRWSNGGRLLAYSSNARNGKDMDLYVADLEAGKPARLLKEVSGDWVVSDWSPDDRRLAVIERISINESYIHLVDSATGQTETVTPHGAAGAPTVSYESVRWSKDGRALYWITDFQSETRRLARYDLAARKNAILTPGIPWDVEDFDLADNNHTIAFVTNEEGISKLRLLDAASGLESPAPELPVGVVSSIRFRKNSLELGLSLSSARAPLDAYTVDLASAHLTRWTHSETGGLDPARFAVPQLVHYPTFDGKSIPAFVYRPGAPHKPPYPVVIQIHGGPEGQYRPGFLGAANDLTSELGIALIFPNVRGSAGFGKTYLNLDNGFHREDAVKDIGALIDWIGKQPDLDAKRVAVLGGSYGGYMVLATMTHYSDRLRAGIDLVGISNFLTFLKHTQSYRRDLRRVEYGDERDPKMKEFLERISPLSSVQKITKPMLVVAGANDPRVPASESDQMVAALRKNGVPVWSIVGKNEGHGFAKKKNQDYLQYAELMFLKEHLLEETGSQ